MELLVALPRQYLDSRGTPDLIFGARRQENGIGHIERHRVSDQLGAAWGVAQHAATPKCPRTAEVRTLTLVKFIERRSQLSGAGVNQIGRRQIADYDAAIPPQNFDNCCR
jgi:hypothetical protein